MSRCWAALVFLLSLLSWTALAQTPEIAAGSCGVMPRTMADLEILARTATPAPGDLEPYTIAEADLPAGPAPDATVREAIVRIAKTRALCLQLQDFGGFWSLYTDEYVKTIMDVDPDAAFNETSEGVVIDYQLGAVTQVTQLADGRVSALVTYVGADIEDSHPGLGVTYLMIFEHVDGTWLIDRQYESYLETATQRIHPVVELLETSATPAA